MRAIRTWVVLSMMVWSVPAAADVRDLELTVPIGLLERSSAAAELPGGGGYESAFGLAAGLEGRLFFGDEDRIFHLGLMLGAQHHAGALFGLDGYAFRTTVIDAGLAARVLLPCMSDELVKWRLSGVLALVGAHADAGMGAGSGDENARAAASEALDHGGLGWRLAFDLSWHVGAFVAGMGLGVRQYFGIDTPVSRVWMMDVGLRLGARFDLFSSGERAAPDPW